MEIKSVAIVTGASQGIGRATAMRLARDFSAVVLVARDKEALETAASEITSVGAEAMVFVLDLRLPQSAETVVKGTVERFGRIDALLNIAGAVPQIDLFEMTDAQWDDGMALKLHGARRLTIRAWDALKASKGSVVLISGSAALDPKPGFAAVAAINAAIIALAKAFAEQGIKDGVQVNSVVPGAVMTGRRQSFFEKWAPAHNLTVGRGHQEVPGGGWHQPLWQAGGDRRSAGLSRVSRGEVDDGRVGTYGRRRGQGHLGQERRQRRKTPITPPFLSDSFCLRELFVSETQEAQFFLSEGDEEMKTWMKIGIPVCLLAVLAAWYAFRPERLVVNRRVDEAMPNSPGVSSAQPLESGRFYSILHPTEGLATVYHLGDGTRVLRLTSFSTSNGPDVHVYMVAADDAKDAATVEQAGFVDLGVIKGNIGDQNYTLGSDLDLAKYRSVSIWCKRFSVNFGAAALRPAQTSQN